jgi:argininosuccinate synthase
MQTFKKVVLAYSGGLDTSVMLHWIKKEYQCEVIAFAADLGQGQELSGLKEKALATGASRIYIEDLRREFVSDFVFPAIQAGATYEDGYLLGTSLSRPLIAKKQIEIAQKENADAVSHGATGKGNDQVRFELTYYALSPDIKVIAPWRNWPFQSRTELIEYAKTHQIPVSATVSKPYSTDRNLMHISFEGGVLEEPWNEPPKDMFAMTQPQEQTPNTSQYVEIEFEKGIPVAWNGKKMAPEVLLEAANKTAGEHGIGRIDIVENRFVGIKSRGVYETPGATVLHTAHRTLESITLDREVLHLKNDLGYRFAKLIYNGFWYSPEFLMLQKTIRDTQERVSGTVRLKLFKGLATVVGRKSSFSLYNQDLATFEKENVYRQADAEGFIRIQALRLRNLAKMTNETKSTL